MKLILFILPLFIFLQVGSCGEDDSSDDGGSINDSFITFLGETNEALGGCNVQSQNNPIFCTYSGHATLANGDTVVISVSHSGVCRTATFNLSDNIDNNGDALVFVQIATNTVVTDTYLGSTGTVDLGDFGLNSSMDLDGEVTHTEDGTVLSISAFIECLN